ncbi:SEFIR domain-containing protein [Leptospira licerasiae]|uniref:SEFIR domain protein n=1 Tax=Leptospira licerasiae str. MMD4847 TaxID=1049971 RepID=A0ABN0HEM9_9LEPT|nr:SEFIR domain-containing protein [Leptospira licerasiae]EIE01213.1 SEFIR domain protein [Leptospira licerasiae serovar Varillal str. VAR 010]EJZ44040.1 SEFIR domain protein [Leptospira licerasiae str. MMD4847]
MEQPKTFISYSWSSPDHENRVLNLATELVNSGVQVILDKWDLKEGNDSIAFMESMVTDPSIQKVILVCDRVYSEKANERKGGVGTEAQIISGEIYRKADQGKFVAVVVEKDQDGNAFLPAYYKNRIYIDLSYSSDYTNGFTQLLRWLYNKPLYQKPEIGKPPKFVSNETSLINSSLLHNHLCKAIRENSDSQKGLLREYLELITDNFEKLRITEPDSNSFDDQVVSSISDFIPYRNEFLEIVNLLSKYETDAASLNQFHKFFESLIPFQYNQKIPGSYRDWDFDNFKFIIQELFLLLIATLLKHERFQTAAYFLSQRYYYSTDRSGISMQHFSIFRQPLASLKFRNSRLKLGRLSLHADLLKERAQESMIDFTSIMQADFVLYFKGILDSIRNEEHNFWWPDTLLYMSHWPKKFEIFARCESLSYFEKVKILFGIQIKGEFSQVFDELAKDRSLIPRWEIESFDPRFMLNFDNLCKYN